MNFSFFFFCSFAVFALSHFALNRWLALLHDIRTHVPCEVTRTDCDFARSFTFWMKNVSINFYNLRANLKRAKERENENAKNNSFGPHVLALWTRYSLEPKSVCSEQNEKRQSSCVTARMDFRCSPMRKTQIKMNLILCVCRLSAMSWAGVFGIRGLELRANRYSFEFDFHFSF